MIRSDVSSGIWSRRTIRISITRPHPTHQVTAKQQSGEAYTYSVRLLDAAGQADHSVPTIPGIKSKLNLDVGDNVAVIFPYGQLAPYIVGKAVIP